MLQSLCLLIIWIMTIVSPLGSEWTERDFNDSKVSLRFRCHRFLWRTRPFFQAPSSSTWRKTRNGGTTSFSSQTPMTSSTTTARRWDGWHVLCTWASFTHCLIHQLCSSLASPQSHDRLLHPKGTINCAGYKVLTSMEQYLNLISNSLPGEERVGKESVLYGW